MVWGRANLSGPSISMSTGDRSYASELEGRASGRGRRFAIVAARFNAHITDVLEGRARATLIEQGTDEAAVETFQVPGAWELPQAAARILSTGRFDALIALGCVVRGETAHFDFIAGEAARGLTDVALRSTTPVIFGVLTTENEEQAVERADPARGDKGREAALAALHMADLYRRIG
jgi:6,7-dimethyl-8-ribityllumazine synthase